MRVEVERLVGWDEVYDSAMFTQRKDSNGKIPSVNWKKKTCIAQHSVLRGLRFSIKLYDAPNFVITHLIRHTKASPQPFVATQREDLTGIPSEEVGRLTPNNLKFDINGEALLFMGQQRLCYKASKETVEWFEEIKKEITKIEPEFGNCLVPQCLFRNNCPEYTDCGFWNNFKHDNPAIFGTIQQRYDAYNEYFHNGKKKVKKGAE